MQLMRDTQALTCLRAQETQKVIPEVRKSWLRTSPERFRSRLATMRASLLTFKSDVLAMDLFHIICIDKDTNATGFHHS